MFKGRKETGKVVVMYGTNSFFFKNISFVCLENRDKIKSAPEKSRQV